MYISKNLFFLSVAFFTVFFIGWVFFTPDSYSALTRVISIRETLPSENRMIDTYNFVENVELIRDKYELGKKMSLENAAERDSDVNDLLLTKNASKELLVYLRIYGKAMYLSTEGTGTYQVVFFSVLKKLAKNSSVEPNLKEELLKTKEQLHLNDTDGGEYIAIIENKPFP